uniref:Uncharacterized protein n=1 Tax=Lepeophtheirus salmonis TaxID=72036 RepID=A0A0K2SVS2_LEPSM
MSIGRDTKASRHDLIFLSPTFTAYIIPWTFAIINSILKALLISIIGQYLNVELNYSLA